jgi:hypothetical protein
LVGIRCCVVWWLDVGVAKTPASSIIGIEEVTAFHGQLFYLEYGGGRLSKNIGS